MTESQSYAAVNAARLSVACTAYIDKMESDKVKEIEAEIDRLMSLPRRTWFGRSRPPMSRPEAEAEIDRNGFDTDSFHATVMMTGRHWINRAKILQRLAIHSEDGVVYLSEDMAFVMKYAPEVRNAPEEIAALPEAIRKPVMVMEGMADGNRDDAWEDVLAWIRGAANK